MGRIWSHPLSNYAASKVHLSPLMMIMDAIGVLFLLVGGHDLLRPASPWVTADYQFPGYVWVLIGGGLLLLALTVLTIVRSFSGKGIVFADDL